LPDTNSTFLYADHIPDIVDIRKIDYDNDGIPELLEVYYALKDRRRVDVVAYFAIKQVNQVEKAPSYTPFPRHTK